jgi:hypothetical protein
MRFLKAKPIQRQNQNQTKPKAKVKTKGRAARERGSAFYNDKGHDLEFLSLARATRLGFEAGHLSQN